jgi:hypothetical protein
MLKITKAIGTGKLLSKKSFKDQLAPTTVGLAGNVPSGYYAMGIVVSEFEINLNKTTRAIWTNQTFGGYIGFFGYFPENGLVAHLEFNTDYENFKTSGELLVQEIIKNIGILGLCKEIKKYGKYNGNYDFTYLIGIIVLLCIIIIIIKYYKI